MWEIKEIGLSSKTCLLPMITQQSQDFIRLYSFYKNNVLAISGGVLEQPAKYLSAMEIIELQVKRDQ